MPRHKNEAQPAPVDDSRIHQLAMRLGGRVNGQEPDPKIAFARCTEDVRRRSQPRIAR